MKKTKMRQLMLDGFLSGAALEGSLELSKTEASMVEKALRNARAELDENRELSIEVQRNGSKIRLALRYDAMAKKYYLNCSGNPGGFLKGQNSYGYVEIDRLIISCFTKAIQGLDIPDSVSSRIADGAIHIHNLEIACYTNKVPDKQKLMNDWTFAYRNGWAIDGQDEVVYLTDLLDLRFTRVHKDHKSSVCLEILNSAGRTEYMLMAYDKQKQMEARSMVVESNIKRRLRLDLTLTRLWFNSRTVNQKRLQTVNDLKAYVMKTHGSWKTFMIHELERALARSLLFYMWSFDYRDFVKTEQMEYEANKRVNRLVGYALVKARALNQISNKKWQDLLMNQSRFPKLNLDPHPYKLKLDPRIVEA